MVALTSVRSLGWTLVIFLMLATGPLASPVTSTSPPATQTQQEVLAGEHVPVSAVQGVLPPLASLDLGAALGLPQGQLTLDSARYPLSLAVAQRMARTSDWGTYPLGPMPGGAAPSPDGTFTQIAQALRLPGDSRAILALADAGALGDQDALLIALEAQSDLERLEARLRGIANGYPGGSSAFVDQLEREARGAPVTATERARMDGRIGAGLRADLREAFADAYFVNRGLAATAPTEIGNPWAGDLARPFAAASDPAALAALARSTTSVPSLMAAAYGAVPRPVADVPFPVAVQHLAEAAGTPLTAAEQAEVAQYAAGLDPEEGRALSRVIEASADAVRATNAAYEAVGPELWMSVDQALQAHQSQGMDAAAPDPKELLRDVSDLLSQVIDRGFLDDVGQAVADAAAAAEALADPLGDGIDSPVLDEPQAVSNLLLIGSAADDVRTTSPIVVIEPSGNDRHRYVDHTGSIGQPTFRLVVDLEGDDDYASSGTGYCGSVGGAYVGVSLLMDFLGNDQYASGSCYMTLGTGYEGLGILWDGAGDDTYRGSSSVATLGGGLLGAGYLIDRAGDDRYDADGAGPAFGASTEGSGHFLDADGDDIYRRAGTSAAFGAGVLGGVSSFIDLAGDDQYFSKGIGYGAGFASVASFLDAGGDDAYEVGSYAPASCVPDNADCAVGNGQTWLGTGKDQTGYVYLVCVLTGLCLDDILPVQATASAGADRELPASPLSNVQARIVAPRSGATVAPGETVPVTVKAVNTGASDLSQVTGTLVVVDTKGGAPFQAQVDFGTIPAGQSVEKDVAWATPAGQTSVQVRLTLAAVGDRDPSDNLDVAALDVASIPMVSVTQLYVTSSGLVPPGSALTPSVVLANRGNVAYSNLQVTLDILSGSNVVGTVQKQVALGRPGPYADPGNVPVELPVTFNVNAPGSNGNYVVRVSVPTSANAPAPAETSQSKAVKVLLARDLAVEPASRSYVYDPGFFLEDGGFAWVVRNTGTVPMSGATLAVKTKLGAAELTSSFNVPDLDPDQSVRFDAPLLPAGPEEGKTWTFSAALTAPTDATPTNDALTRTVTFQRNAIMGLDFEVPGGEVAVDDARWSRGKPSFTTPPVGPNAWSTGMNGNFPTGSSQMRNHDLVLPGFDLRAYLDPRVEFAHTLDDPSGYAPSNWGMLGSFWARRAGESSFVRLTPEGDYPCKVNYSQSDTGPGYCDTRPWSTAAFDLSAYSGQVVDLMFRLAMPSYVSSAARGWTIDDLRLYGARRIDLDLDVLGVQYPEPLLSGTAVPVTISVRNNGYTAVSGVDVDVHVRKGTNGFLQVLQATGPSTLAPLEIGQYTLQWTPAQATFYTYTAKVQAAAADPRVLNNEVTGMAGVHDLVRGYDPETADMSQWGLDASNVNDWQLGVPGGGDHAKKAYTGTRVFATNLNGGYSGPPSGTYAEYDTLTAPAHTISGGTPGDLYALTFAHSHELTSYSPGFASDFVYPSLKVNAATKLLAPPDGFESLSGTYYSPQPPDGADRGYFRSSNGWTQAALPIGPLSNGDVIQPRFHLYADYCYSCTRASGWSLDDIRVLRLPRFDADMKAEILGPAVLDIGSEEGVAVRVHNLGRNASPPVPLTATLHVTGQVVEGTVTVPALQPGAVRDIEVPLDVPFEVGLADIEVALAWPQDEWSANNADDGVVRLARVLYRNDFESGTGGFDSPNGFKHGTRPDGLNIQGQKSWYTGPITSGSAALQFPPLDLDTGLTYPQVLLTGKTVFSISSCGGMYSLANHRLFDQTTGKPLAMSPLALQDIYSYYGFGTKGHCNVNPMGSPLAFAVDVTNRQVTDPQLDLVWQGKLYCCGSGVPNHGMELDDVALFAIPYGRNVAVGGFLSPPGGLLGPGEEVPVTVDVVGGGISWPEGAVGLHLHSNDALGPGGTPSLNEVVPIPRLDIGERHPVSVAWRPAQELDGQVLTLSARLVDLSGSAVQALADENLQDNIQQKSVSVLSVHNMAVDLLADPNVDPDQVRPVNVVARVSNLGTRTENGVRVTLEYTDLDTGQPLSTSTFGPVQKRPDVAQPAHTFSQVWTPPAPGHYGVRATLTYGAIADEVDALGLTDVTQIHAAALPPRVGSDFDDAADPDGWSTLGGRTALGGFATRLDPARGAVLATGAYESNAHYAYTFLADLPASAAQLDWAQRLDLGAGDVAKVQASVDGATWQTLASYTGQAPWADRSVDLTPLGGTRATLRFLLQADGAGQASGWSIDDVRVVAAGSTLRALDFESRYGETLQSWDFESGAQGWTADADAPTGASSGINDWERGTPAGLTVPSGSNLWKTNLEGDYTEPCYSPYKPCPTPDNTFGSRRLTSPAFTVPSGREQVTLTWWQWHDVFPGYGYCYTYGCYGAAADAAAVRIVVDGEQVPVEPLDGYNLQTPLVPGGRGWSGSSGGWLQKAVDLSDFAGKSVQAVFDLTTPQGEFYRGYYVSSTYPGVAIDDVRLMGTPLDTAPNTGVIDVKVAGTPLAGKATPATVRLVRSVDSRPVSVEFEWIGEGGQALPTPAGATVTVGPSGTSVPFSLPAVDAQRTLLRVRAVHAPGTPDARAIDNVLETAVVVEQLVYSTAFGSSSDAACAKTSPCQSWTHNAELGTDEWEHGPIPSSKAPGSAHSAPHAFATDITGSTYEANSRYVLSSPSIEIPEDATLRFWHALETAAPYCCGYLDGGTVSFSDTVLYPETGYTADDCGYYAQDLPCWSGTFGWREEALDLGPLAGRTGKLQFQFAAQYQYGTPPPPSKSGWALDDILISGAPPAPESDLVVSAPATLQVSPLDPQPATVGVRNVGTTTSAAGMVRAVFYRGGNPLPAQTAAVPGLAPGADWALSFELPSGPLDDLRLEARLLKANGSPWADGNPANDAARSRVAPSYVVASMSAADGIAPLAGDDEAPAFQARAPAPEGGAPERAFVAGFGQPLAREQSLVLPSVAIPPGADLTFLHRVKLGGQGDGAFVEASLDNGRSWAPLSPDGGYPDVVRFSRDSPCVSEGEQVGACFTGDRPWQQSSVALDGLAGKTAWLRFRYVTTASTPASGGWAIEAIRLTAAGQVENLLDETRWSLGPIRNRAGPIEEASQPNAWGTGLDANLARPRSFDVLASPPIASKHMLGPTVSFDWYGAPEAGSLLLVQARGASGEWRPLGVLAGETPMWQHAELPMGELGDWTQVRFVTMSPDAAKLPRAAPGYFIDNVLVGSLTGKVEVILPTAEPGAFLDVAEATNVTLPVRVSNPGAFSNRYALEVRGADPTWTGTGANVLALAPGQSATTSVTISIPYLRDGGVFPVQVLARSLFDPLQAAIDEIQLNVSVAPKPDYVVKAITFQSSFLVEGDPVRHVEDARPNTLIAEIENVGRAPGLQDLEVLFVEYTTDGEVRPIDVAMVPTLNLTEPGHPDHAPYGAFVEWFPRKGIVGVAAIANPEALGNRFPANPESNVDNNEVSVPVVVEPRPLPELQYAATPSFSRLPQVDLPVSLGVDLRNGGNAPTLTPVDVALLANPQDAFLTSPVLQLPSNGMLRLVYSSDLELRADGFVVEARPADGDWERLVPNGGYPHGCLLGLGCESGVSGRADHRVLTFDLGAYEGPSQLRLRFAMDSHNGRTFDGLELHELSVQQFLATTHRFDFGNTGSGWEATPQFQRADGEMDTVFKYRGREGPIPGAWTIPVNYANPALVSLRSVRPIGTGSLEHVDLDWTPRAGGDLALRLLVDPKNAEPEYIDEMNQLDFAQRIAVSGFALQPATTTCSGAALCLADAEATGDMALQLVNTGNTRSRFQVTPQVHPFLDAVLMVGGRQVTSIELDAGAAVDAVLRVRAHQAPAGVQTLQFDVQDTAVGKVTKLSLPVRVLSGATGALKIEGLAPFDVVSADRQTATVGNPSNQVVPVLLRAGEKPSGLAVRITPSEFTLAPFEARTVEIELLNLGVVAKSYDVPLINARAACATGTDCGLVATMKANVAEYAPPSAAFTVSGSLRPNTPVSFEDASTSKGSRIVAWRWDFGDGATSTDAKPEHTYLRPGTFAVSLKVTDDEGQTGTSAPRTIVVANDPPKAMASRSQVAPRTGVPINFTAAESLDLDGGVTKVTWAFGDGSLVTGLNVTHTYREPGTYRVVVAVEDAYGAVDLHEMTLVVEGQPVLDLASGSRNKESPVLPWLALAALAVAVALRRRRA